MAPGDRSIMPAITAKVMATETTASGAFCSSAVTRVPSVSHAGSRMPTTATRTALSANSPYRSAAAVNAGSSPAPFLFLIVLIACAPGAPGGRG